MWLIVTFEYWFCEDSKEYFEDEEMLQRNLDKVNEEVIKQRAYMDSLPKCTQMIQLNADEEERMYHGYIERKDSNSIDQ